MTHILYHGNCYDGFGAALAAWIHFNAKGQMAQFTPVHYGQDPPPIPQGSEIIIVDFSYPPKVLLEMAKGQNTIIVLDHHATAMNDLCASAFKKELALDTAVDHDLSGVKDDPDGLSQCLNIHWKFDMNKSGCVMAWEYFNPGKPVPLFFQYLQDRDLWEFKMPHSREVSSYMRTVPLGDYDHWYHVMREMESDIGRREIVSAGTACEKLTSEMVNLMASNARTMVFDLHKATISLPVVTEELHPGQVLVPVANATVFFSEVGNELLKKHPEAQVSAYYMDRGDGKRQWGMRSRKDYDCSIIAKAFGGGGHKQASGFITEIPW